MSMHMIKGVQVHGNSHKKKSKKIDMEKMYNEWRQYNKRMRNAYLHAAQFDSLQDYIDYRMGKTKIKKREFKTYEPPKTNSRRDSTKEYPSLSTDSIPGPAARTESPKYSGDYIVGIATMHKSNLVPVGRGDDPENYSTMRRN